MADKDMVIKALGCSCGQPSMPECPCEFRKGEHSCDWNVAEAAIALLKEQDNEAKRIMKVIWDTLHEGLSIDTVAEQDWVYELIRHRIEDR